jgi:hypothetical protein
MPVGANAAAVGCLLQFADAAGWQALHGLDLLLLLLLKAAASTCHIDNRYAAVGSGICGGRHFWSVQDVICVAGIFPRLHSTRITGIAAVHTAAA